MWEDGHGVRETYLVATLEMSEMHSYCREAEHGSQILGSNETEHVAFGRSEFALDRRWGFSPDFTSL